MNALPTRQCLSRCHLIPASLCPVCQFDSETVTHALWACPHARNVWALIPGRIQKLHVEIGDFFLLTQDLTQSLNRQELEMWVVTCWSTWNACNKLFHEAVMNHPSLIFDNAMRLLQDFHRVLAAQRLPFPS
ncbi:putative ribonuclease h protein [Fagus crenata]